jgi:hypothetical protein
MRILETFDQFLKRGAHTILEQESSTSGGFIAVIGSTDKENLLTKSAEPLGIKQDVAFSLKINGLEEMLKIGAAKKFENVGAGKKVSSGLDYLTIKTGGKTYTVKETGSTKVPFNASSVLEIEGAGNGLLALLRALIYLNVSISKNKFDTKSPFDGILVVKLGGEVADSQRKGTALSVNGKYDQPNGVRWSEGYADIEKRWRSFLKEALAAEDKPQEETPGVDQLILVADTMADAIKAAHFMKENAKWKSKFSAFNGFSEMIAASPKGFDSYFLAVAFQFFIGGLSERYPIDTSKIYKVDLMNYTDNILKAQPKDLKSFDGASIKKELSAMLKIFQPKSLKDYPDLNQFLPKYWEVVTNAIVNRIISRMPETYKSAMSNDTIGSKVGSTGGIETGGKSYGSGKVD